MGLSAALLAHGPAWSLRHGWRPERLRARWVLAGWLVAAWQLTYGFATGIWFGYFLALLMLGWTVGCLLGCIVGCEVGRELGCWLGCMVGCLVGWEDGWKLGCVDG